MKQALLIPLDALLDTRLALLDRHDPTVAKAIVSSDESLKKYQERINDEFSEFGLKGTTFKELWDARDGEILRNSSVTALAFELDEFVEQLHAVAVTEPHRVTGIEIHVNMYPYKLEAHVRDVLCSAIAQRIRIPVMVKPVYYSDRDLSPFFFGQSEYTGLFVYDFEKWVSHHYGANAIEDEALYMPQFTIYAPSIFPNLDKLKEAVEYTNPNGETCDPIEGIQFMFKPFFHLELLGPVHYSIIDPKVMIAYETKWGKKSK